MTLPIHEYSHSVGRSVVGGYVYRASTLPQLNGQLLLADFSLGKIWHLDYNPSQSLIYDLVDTNLFISSFGQDNSGKVYFLSYFEGKIYHFQDQTMGN